MKAPDKIYLGVGPMSGDEPNKRYIYAEWNENPMQLVQNIEYIRKNALLEWVKEIAENASWVSIDAVVNKIESL